jgi:putative ABC transport system ATP-binding protein
MVTHSREVADGAQRIVRMRDGRVVDDGTRPPAPREPDALRGSVTVPVPLRIDALTGRRPDRAPGRQP